MMQLLEVKNDIAKIMYNPTDNKLLPSDFLLIEDFNQKLVGQILSVYTTEDLSNNFADVRLALYIDKNDKLSYYNGYIPPRTAKVMYITADEITEMIADSQTNIYLGNLTYHPKSIVKTPLSLINEKLYIQCDREDNRKIILQNLVSELYMKQRKVVLLDFDGRYNKISNVPRLIISESFKFPLNEDAFDTILEYDTADCPIEDKAVIQGIVLELIDYIKTLENKFLPFTLFKNVVISEFSSNPISGLMLLRNKLWQYAQDGIFAETKADFDIVNLVLEHENIVIIDASKIEEKWHKFAVQSIPKILNKHCYFALNLNDIPMDKRSVLDLYNNSIIVPIVSTSYDSQLRNILKSLSKNQILFKPAKQTEVDDQYGSLIHKLNSDDFILFGEASLNLPLIINLKPFDIKTSEKIAEQEIRRNVDRILSTGKSMLPKEAVLSEISSISNVSSVQYTVDEDFNDEDLDFLDNIREETISVEDLKNVSYSEEKKQEEYDLFAPFVETTEQIKNNFLSISEIAEQEKLDKGNPILQFDIDEIIKREEQAQPEEFEQQIDTGSEVTDYGVEFNSVEYNNQQYDVSEIENGETDIETAPENKKIPENVNEIINETEQPLIADDAEEITDIGLDIVQKNNEDELIIELEDDIEEEENSAIKETNNNILDGDIILHDENENNDNSNENEIIREDALNDILEQDEKALENILTDEILEEKSTESETEEENESKEEIIETIEIIEEKKEEEQSSGEEDMKNDDKTPLDGKAAVEETTAEIPTEVIVEVETELDNKEEEIKEISIEKEVADESQINAENEQLINNEEQQNIEEPQMENEKVSVEEIEEQSEVSETVENETIEQEQTTEEQINNENNENLAPLEEETPEIKKQEKNQKKQIVKSNEEEIVSINSIINNIKSKVQNSAKNTIEKIKEVKEERKSNKNKPPLPAEITTNRVHKKELTVYETDTATNIVSENTLPFKVGDKVYHPKHGKGVVEGFANYSNKILFCQIEFENVGRRILDPRISGLEKID